MLLGRDDHGCSLVMGAGAGVEVLVAGGPNTAQAEIFSPAGVAWRKAATLAHTDYGPAMALVEGVPTVMGGYQLEEAEGQRLQDRVQQYLAGEDRWEVLHTKLQVARSHATAIEVPKSVFCN